VIFKPLAKMKNLTLFTSVIVYGIMLNNMFDFTLHIAGQKTKIYATKRNIVMRTTTFV
jgi:hypothetical protein